MERIEMNPQQDKTDLPFCRLKIRQNLLLFGLLLRKSLNTFLKTLWEHFMMGKGKRPKFS